MEYGILVVEADVEGIGVWDHYQIIGPVDSIDEAREIAQNYLVNGPESGCLAPDRFVIHQSERSLTFNTFSVDREPNRF